MKSVQRKDYSQSPDSLLPVNPLQEHNKHIMIVDDDTPNRLILRNILLEGQYDVHECSTGNEALEYAQTCKPDLILLNMTMPYMAGCEFHTFLKEHPEITDIPILLITLLTDSEQTVKTFELDAADYLTKPFYRKEVLARIRWQLLLKEKRESPLQHSGKLEQLVIRESQKLMQAKHHIAYGRAVQGILSNLKHPSIILTKGMERVRKAHNSLAESFEMEADLNSDLMETHLRRIDRALSLVENASEKLSDIVTSLLHRITNSQNTDSQILDINTVIHEEINFLKADPFFANQVTKKIRLSGHSLPVAAKQSELALLFENLLSNSIDAMQQQNTEAVINIETRRVGTRAEITISDNGCGITEENLEHIFIPFFSTKYRGENSSKTSEHDLSGTGLGLFMCHNIVQSLRGEIAVKNTPTPGVTFYISLPMAIPEEPQQADSNCNEQGKLKMYLTKEINMALQGEYHSTDKKIIE